METSLDDMLKRQAERLATREDPQPVAEQPGQKPFDLEKATPGKYRLAVAWTCCSCGSVRTLDEEQAVAAALRGQPIGVKCGAEVPGAEGEAPKKCGQQMGLKPGFHIQRPPGPLEATNRAERRALASVRRRT